MNLLAIGAHPDDIEYGCGGSLMKYRDKGANLFLLIMTEGEEGGDAATRRAEQEASAKIMDVRQVIWADERDTRIAVTKQLISEVESVIHSVDPEFILVNGPGDTHQDHRNLNQVAVSAARYVRNVLFYEVPTTVDFSPTVFIDIGNHLERKLQLLEAHRSQIDKTNIKDLSILDSARSSAIFRGIQGRVKYAEGFMPMRLFVNV